MTALGSARTLLVVTAHIACACVGHPTVEDSRQTEPTQRPQATALTASKEPSPPVPSAAEPPKPSATNSLQYVHRTLGGNHDDELPWIVAFHGLGDTPEGFSHLFDGLPLQAHIYLPRAPLSYGAGYDWFGARVTGDQERLTLGIQTRLADVTDLLRHLAHARVNRGKAVVTGFSQGGILSFAVAAANLDHVKRVLPIAGWLPPELAAARPVIPVVAFHGEADQVVPFAATRALVSQWTNSAAGDLSVVTLRPYPGVAHAISPAVLHDWAREVQIAISTQ